MTLALAVLAHDRPESLADEVANLRAFAPDADVLVFNGGTNERLTAGLGVDTCPYSRPLVHHWLGSFQGLLMQWLAEEDRQPEFLVTLDSDMLMLKPGLLDFLRRTMAGAAYMGPHLGEVLPDTDWRPGRRFHRKWEGAWQQLFGLPHPYRAFNPGQVFSRQYIDAFFSWPQRERLMRAIAATRLDALEEIVWPTLAVTLGIGTVSNPGGRSLQLRRHSPAEIADYLRDPDVFLLHRVGMDVDAPERRILRAVASGVAVDPATEPYDYVNTTARTGPVRAAAAYAKDAYLALAPARRSRA